MGFQCNRSVVVVVVGDNSECVFALFRFQVINRMVNAERDACRTTLVLQPNPLELGDILGPNLNSLAVELLWRFHNLAQRS